MESMDKYYTPDPEEICVGLEVQANSSDPNWLDHTIARHNIEPILYDLNTPGRNQSIRIKYLDEEDFKSLGFTFRYENERHFQTVYTKKIEDHPKGWKNRYNDLIYNFKSKWLLIAEGDSEIGYEDWETKFAGEIKNKSELKKLLKQLKIQ